MTNTLFFIVRDEIQKVLGTKYYTNESKEMWIKLFANHGEEYSISSPLTDSLSRIYAKSGAKTLQEFQDYLELQLTFL